MDTTNSKSHIISVGTINPNATDEQLNLFARKLNNLSQNNFGGALIIERTDLTDTYVDNSIYSQTLKK